MRMTGGTAMNNESSRSHAIFTITLEQTKNETDLIKSKFHLVDLAGSERQSKTKAEGTRLRESTTKNLSLFHLKPIVNVIVNIDPQVAELNNLREQNQLLKAQNLQLRYG